MKNLQLMGSALGLAMTGTLAAAVVPGDFDSDKGVYVPLTKNESADLKGVLTAVAQLGENVEVIERWKTNGPIDLGLLDTETDSALKKALGVCDFESSFFNTSKNLGTTENGPSKGSFGAGGSDCGISLASQLVYSAEAKRPTGSFSATLTGDFKIVKESFSALTDIQEIAVQAEAGAAALGNQSQANFKASGFFVSKKVGRIPFYIYLASNIAGSTNAGEHIVAKPLTAKIRFKLKDKFVLFSMDGQASWGVAKKLIYKVNDVDVAREEFFSYLGTPQPHQAGTRLANNGFPTDGHFADKFDCALRVAIDPWLTTESNWDLISWQNANCGAAKAK